MKIKLNIAKLSVENALILTVIIIFQNNNCLTVNRWNKLTIMGSIIKMIIIAVNTMS